VDAPDWTGRISIFDHKRVYKRVLILAIHPLHAFLQGQRTCQNQDPFTRHRCRMHPDGRRDRLELPEKTDWRSEFWTAGQTFSPPTTRAAPEFSHRLATCVSNGNPFKIFSCLRGRQSMFV
jgi:hypothetical protein